jgi:hypothetical protein
MMVRRPLAETTQSPVARALLRSAARDEAPPQTPDKVAAALGLALPTSLTAVGVKAAAGSAGAAKVGLWGTSMGVAHMAKLVLVSAALSGVVFVGARQAVRHRDPPSRAASVPALHSRVPRARSAVSTPPPEQQPAPPIADAESAPEPRPAPAPVRAVGSLRVPTSSLAVQLPPAAEPPSAPVAAFPAPGLADTAPSSPLAARTRAAAPASAAALRLEREVKWLDAARRALAEGRPALAMSLLDQRQAQIGAGTLYPESVIVRVQALLALGRRTDAEHAAEAILASAPGSRHADALRSLLGSASARP